MKIWRIWKLALGTCAGIGLAGAVDRVLSEKGIGPLPGWVRAAPAHAADWAHDPAPTQPNRPAPSLPRAQARRVDPGNGPWRGGKNPKVTIVEWADFQCPHCAQAEPTIEQILETYKEDVRVVWRNKPHSFHQQGFLAAKAAMAAHKQDKFWQMHDKLFADQQQLSPESYEKWAREIGLDVASWKRDLESPEIAELIAKDSSYGQSVGVGLATVFFINGKMIVGAWPFDKLKPIVDEEIRKADERLKRGTPPEKLYEALVDENFKAFHGKREGTGAGSSSEVARR